MIRIILLCKKENKKTLQGRIKENEKYLNDDRDRAENIKK